MKRRALALAAVGLLTAGCGTVDLSSADGSAEGAADATEGIREASLDVAEEEAAAPFFCDGGYGIVAIDATGLHMLTQSCLDAGPPVPTATRGGCGDTCLCVVLQGCGDGANISIDAFACGGGLSLSQSYAVIQYGDPDASPWGALGTVTVTSIGPVDAGVGGEYQGQLRGPDGGDAGSISGSFCVERLVP